MGVSRGPVIKRSLSFVKPIQKEIKLDRKIVAILILGVLYLDQFSDPQGEHQSSECLEDLVHSLEL